MHSLFDKSSLFPAIEFMLNATRGHDDDGIMTPRLPGNVSSLLSHI